MSVLTKPANNILELIGNTPMVRVQGLDTGPCELYLKLENQNPSGSIKDRIALSMIERAEREGLIKPGGTIVEGTAGNTGLGLALIAAQKGYKLILVIPDRMTHDKVLHLRAMGAQVVLARSDVKKGNPEYYQDRARRIAEGTPNSFFINQFANDANPYAHETTTAPEMWEQMDGRIDAFVAGVGSGGTISGIGRFLKAKNPNTEIILADPKGSIMADMVKHGQPPEKMGKWTVEGIGKDFVPNVMNLDVVDRAYSVPDAEAMAALRDLLLKDGILGGSSTGTLLAGALRYCREQTEVKRVVTLVPDTGNKYLAKAFNDTWMEDEGFLKRDRFDDLRDYISRPHAKKSVVTIKPTATLMAAYTKMKLYDFSQLPVMNEDDDMVGIITETDIMNAIQHNEDTGFEKLVSDAMASDIVTLEPSATIEELNTVFNKGLVPVIADQEQFYGLITPMDVLNKYRADLRAKSL